MGKYSFRNFFQSFFLCMWHCDMSSNHVITIQYVNGLYSDQWSRYYRSKHYLLRIPRENKYFINEFRSRLYSYFWIFFLLVAWTFHTCIKRVHWLLIPLNTNVEIFISCSPGKTPFLWIEDLRGWDSNIYWFSFLHGRFTPSIY